jgi:hypothetical protein
MVGLMVVVSAGHVIKFKSFLMGFQLEVLGVHGVCDGNIFNTARGACSDYFN